MSKAKSFFKVLVRWWKEGEKTFLEEIDSNFFSSECCWHSVHIKQRPSEECVAEDFWDFFDNDEQLRLIIEKAHQDEGVIEVVGEAEITFTQDYEGDWDADMDFTFLDFFIFPDELAEETLRDFDQ